MRLGRDEQFRSYVLDQRSALLRTATLLTAGDGHLAEDLVQATLTRLYVSWPLFAKAANRDAYARRALSNALMDEHRRPWRRHERPSTVVPERATEDTADSSERVEALNRALRELPPRMRAAVVYRYFHDLSVADTADALSCSQGTVKSQTARALDRLRSALGQHLAEPPALPPASRPSAITTAHTSSGALDV
jgi:RNA polymerase sigma-70 factor (sigma-E family)